MKRCIFPQCDQKPSYVLFWFSYLNGTDPIVRAPKEGRLCWLHAGEVGDAHYYLTGYFAALDDEYLYALRAR